MEMFGKRTLPHTALAATAAIVALGAQTAKAQPPAPAYGPSFYGTLGYAGHDVYGADLGTVQGRLGARFGRYFGVEGEFGAGVDHAGVGPGQRAGINDQETVYGVAYLPLAPGFDLFGRIGYGRTEWDYKGLNHPGDDDRNWNYGGGAQWFWSRKNGVRADYTKENFDHAPDSDTWAVSYVRRF
jgi:outer membrane immunogenic protein